MIRKSDDDEDYSQEEEAPDLDGLSAECIDGCDGEPVAGD